MSFLRKQISGQEKCTVFFNLIRKTRKQGITIKQEEYEWGPPDFKVYPSSLKVNMCPVELFLSCLEFNGITDLTAIYRVSRGKALHWELQQDLLLSDKIYQKPNLTNATDRIKEKLEANWPEVPFHCLETGVSGSADGVIDWKGPTPVEIKSTSQSPEKWPTYIQEQLPSAQHLIQIGSYMWFFNRLGYYDKECEKGILAYQNTLMPPGDQKAEEEFVVYLQRPHPVLEKMGHPETLFEIIDNLFLRGLVPVRNQVLEQWETYLQTQELKLDCSYSKCSKHSGKSRVKIRSSS